MKGFEMFRKNSSETIPDNIEGDLNKMLAFELIKPDELWLHVDDARDLSLTEKLKLLREGLRELAIELEQNQDLREVKRISGISWIIAKNPKLIESLGFTISESLEGLEDQMAEYDARKDFRDIHLDIPPRYAYIEREKFIALYGNDGESAPTAS